MRTECSSALLGERYTRIDHGSGLEIYVFPKRMRNVYAVLAVKCGSFDNAFCVNGQAVERVPDGVAHFLEHKLFEDENGEDAFATFSAFGADANAYTTYDRTAYLFGCTEHFEENLTELLHFVRHPYFTERSVQKERGIIAEEIQMYEDSPWERVYQNLLGAMYHQHPVRQNVCGSVQSIQTITPQILYRYYQTFYTLSNMVLVVCGDVTPDMVEELADRVLTTASESSPKAERVLPNEPSTVASGYAEARMQTAKPIFNIGIKEDVLPLDPSARLRRDLTMGLLHEILFSQSGEFYSTLFEEGLLTPSFSSGYSSAPGMAFHCMSGESDAPEAVLERMRCFVARMCRDGIREEDFERCRRALYADEIRAYDSTEEIANRLLSFVFDGCDMLSIPSILLSLQKSEAEELLHNFWREDRLALSVILPLSAEKIK